MINQAGLIAICFFSWVATCAQSPQKDLESSIDTLNRAMISRDKTVLERLTADELSYGHSTGTIEDKSAFVNNVLTGSTTFSTINFSDQHMAITDDIAIVRNIGVFKGNTKEGILDIKIGLLMIWQKKGGHWRLIARQGYKLP